MRCLNCGKEGSHYLCDNCTNMETMDKVFSEVLDFDPNSNECSNPFILATAAEMNNKFEIRNLVLPDIITLFPRGEVDYYYCKCRHRGYIQEGEFESMALEYLSKHSLADIKTQTILYDLVDRYIPKDFYKPRKWCDLIKDSEGLAFDLYYIATRYYSMIAEYEEAATLLNKCITLSENPTECAYIYRSADKLSHTVDNLKKNLDHYRDEKPYWPTDENARRQIASFYDRKGIAHPRIENMPKKVPEEEFAGFNECFDRPDNYCAFWCSGVTGVKGTQSIYAIAAVKVNKGTIKDTFTSYIKPVDGRAYIKKAAKVEGVTEDVIAEHDVDIVLKDFFEFIGDSVLVSTDALGGQWTLLSRAARYSGMTCIKNELLDLLDVAADISPDYDGANNTREHLLSAFSIKEGSSTIDKAKVNKEIYEALKNSV